MNESPTIPQAVLSTDMPVEPQKPKSNIKTVIPWILTLIFLCTSGFLFYQNQKLAAPTRDSQPLPSQAAQQDPTADWQTYTDTVLGVQFKLPKQFEVLEQIGKEVAGDTGSQYCIHFVRTQSYRFIPRVEAGAGPCAGSGLVIGSTTTTYSAGREGGFGDMHGYSVNQNRYSALFVQGDTFEIPSSLVTEKTNRHGVHYIVIAGANSEQDMGGEKMSVPILGTPGEGHIGALVNLPTGKYPGFSIQLPIQSPEDTALFETILSTLQLNKNTSSIPASINEVFTAINQDFQTNLEPTRSTQFYSMSGYIQKESWLLPVTSIITTKQNISRFYNTMTRILTEDMQSAADGVGKTIRGYQNDRVYCFYLGGINGDNVVNCSEK